MFQAVPWLPGPHAQTIVPSIWPAPEVPGPLRQTIVDVGEDSAVRLDVNRPRGATPRGTVLLVHGMCGDAESSYMRRTAVQALARGWTAVRMNLRNCGGTAHLSRTLYNAGQSGDVARVVDRLLDDGYPQPLVAAGFSLGGNIVLRHVGEAGADCRLAAAAGVNPPVDLALCARAIERPGNRLYQLQYVWRLCRQLDRIRGARPSSLPVVRRREIRTLREFDERFTAPDAGYPSADAYYRDASAGPRLEGIVIPTLILSAANDPFVPVEMFGRCDGAPRVLRLHPPRGGHCGYWQRGRPRYSAGQRVLDFFESSVNSPGTAARRPPPAPR